MSVKCGNHNGTTVYHNTVADVRACFDGFHSMEFAAPVTTEPKPVRKPTANEKHVLDKLRKAIHDEDPTAAARSARYAEIWREDEADGPLDEGNWTEQVPAGDQQEADERGELHRNRFAATAPAARPLRTSPKGREMPASFGGSPKQYDLLFSLNEERGLSLDLSQYGSVGVASRMITAIFAGEVKGQPKAAPAKAAGPALATEDGIYRNPATGEIFKVQFNKAQGDGRNLYAKRLVLNTYGDDVNTTSNIPLTGERPTGDLVWLYAGGIARAGVLAAWRMTREDAAAFGALYGVCVRCHRDLTAEDSIERAMGPICAGKMGW